MRATKKQQRIAAALEQKCADWNERYPVGTPVFYHPIIGEPERQPFVTRTKAYVLSGHTPVVFLEGKSGCVYLEAIEANIDALYEAGLRA